MSRAILWFWYLVLIWFSSFCITSRLVSAAEDTKVERSFSGYVKSFLLGSDELSKIPSKSPVTVIASRLPSFRTPLNDIPANVTYKLNQDFKIYEPRFVQESIQDVEGALFFDQVGNGVDTTFGLRGFSEGGVIGLLDGVRINEVDGGDINYPLIPMHDIESIQIERGSASPIYGSGAFGGVINMVTKQPSEKPFSAFGGLELSSFIGIKFNQGISGSIHDRITPVGGKLFYFFSGARDLNDGFRDNGEWRITSFNTKAGYELPDEEGKIEIGVKHIDNALSNAGALTLAEFKEDPEQTKTPLAGRDFNNTIIQISGDKKWWDNKITTSILADWRLNQIHFFTTSRTFTDCVGIRDFGTGACTGTLFDPDTDRLTVKSRQRGLVLQGAYEDRWSWFGAKSEIGMEFQRTVQSDLQQDFFQGRLFITTPEEDQIAKARSVALFWRETASFWEKIIMHVGMRHDYDWLKVRESTVTTNNFDQRWHDSTISTGLTLKPIGMVDIFGNYSQGFRVPDISDIASLAEFGGSVSPNLRPETSDSYEAGTRFHYEDLVQYKLSYFLIDLKDEIAFDSNTTATNPFGQNINIAASRRTGIENRLDFHPIKEADMYGSFTWMKAYVRETDNDNLFFDGRSIGLVPSHRYTTGIILHPFRRLGGAFEDFGVGLSGVYVGRQHVQSYQSASQANLNAAGHIIKPYTVWNFMVSYAWRGKKIYFKINNLFDEKYFSRAVIASKGSPGAFGPSNTPSGTNLFVNPGAPREYVLGMTWEFGD